MLKKKWSKMKRGRETSRRRKRRTVCSKIKSEIKIIENKDNIVFIVNMKMT